MEVHVLIKYHRHGITGYEILEASTDYDRLAKKRGHLEGQGVACYRVHTLPLNDFKV